MRRRIDPATGELGRIVECYGSAQELDGITWVRCGDRRAYRCESCSHEYKGDAWHLLAAGLAGGKGIPETVASHPTVFVTLTPPSFGPVHGLRHGAPCRARRDKPTCPHGRPLWCLHRHKPTDRRLGEPLCDECYDYEGHVLWQWWAPELWRRFTIGLGRLMAQRLGVTEARLRELAKVAYTKVAEFQARGLIHVHAVMRLDGPDGPRSMAGVPVDVDELTELITTAARSVRKTARFPGSGPVELRWGDQTNVRAINHAAGRDVEHGVVHPGLVAAYLAKYLTKATEDFGLDGRVHSAVDARYLGASPHAVRIIDTAERLAAGGGDDYELLDTRYGTLGYRGHVVTKTRRYSTTFGALRQARRDWHRRRQLDNDDQGDEHGGIVRELPAADDLEDLDASTVVLRRWRYAGRGYFDLDTAVRALAAAARTREHSHDCDACTPDP